MKNILQDINGLISEVEGYVPPVLAQPPVITPQFNQVESPKQPSKFGSALKAGILTGGGVGAAGYLVNKYLDKTGSRTRINVPASAIGSGLLTFGSNLF